MDKWIGAISDSRKQNAQIVTSPEHIFCLIFCLLYSLYSMWIAFVDTGMFRLFSRCNTACCAQARTSTHTQTYVNTQCGHVDRVLELWLQADSV